MKRFLFENKNFFPILLAFVFLFSGCASNTENVAAKKLSTNEAATVRVSATESDAAEPALAAAPDGGIYLVWVEHGKEKDADIFLQKFDKERKPQDEVVRVNAEKGRATAWRGDPPSVKVGSDGVVYVLWTARVEPEDKHASDLLLSVSKDGKTFAPPVKINDDSVPASHGLHSLAVDDKNRVYVAWLDERYLKTAAPHDSPKAKMPENHVSKQHAEPNRELYFAVSNDGGRTFSANKKLAGDVCPCCKTSLAVAKDARVYVSWRQVLPGDFRHVAVASSADGGNSFDAPVIVSDDRWQIAGCPVSGAALNVDDKNALKILWFTAGATGKTGLYASESTDGGKTFAPRKLVYEGTAFGTPFLQFDEKGNCRTLWSADGKLFAGNSVNAQDFREIADGELPVAALDKENRLLVAFVRKENDRRGVWLSVF